MDGDMTMRQLSHFEWCIRAVLLLAIYLLRQLPMYYRVCIDTEKFLDSISMEYEGERYRGQPWALAPNGDLHDPSAGRLLDTEARKAVRKTVMETLYPKVASAIPTATPEFEGSGGRPGRLLVHVAGTRSV